MPTKRVRIDFPISLSEHQKVLKKLGGGERLASAQITELLAQPVYKDVVKTALQKHAQGEELKQYQVELIKLQEHMERTGRKLIILFDGRDASGKGGTIRRVTRYMNSKHYRVVALGKPSEAQQTQMHMKRYIEQFPSAGEIVLFDRSWYNRAMVEPVMGFCRQDQYRQFMETIITFERSLLEDHSTTLIKMYFSVSKEEQARRFEIRKRDPLRRWKLSEVDMQAQELWDKFTDKKYQLLLKTNKPDVPWYVLRSDDKHHVRIEAMKLILRSCPYRGRSRTLDFLPNKKVFISGDQELRTMQAQKRKHGKFQG
ncbi:MAG: hypothetical protein WBN37_01345 [Arenicellales bacterium]